jgi:tetratricopeptide (TPR) repeat protein/archaellum biogenesis ATPase FlaH
LSKVTTRETSTVAENPLYRKVFVGREHELKQLQSAFDGAISGQGALMMVVGEPGIGKTAICDQLRTYVTLRGGKTLLGHCYEEGSLSLPYLAFVEAMRSYVLSREVKDLREELGTGAVDVARIVSEVRDRLKIKPRSKVDPEEERYRLMQAVTGFLSNAANVQPLLVVLEDLHDSDKGTLDMLTHVSRHLAGTRLLVVGTYRDVEVDRNHPLSAALAELRRVSTYGRVLLRGLNPDEVRRMLESITREEVPWNLAEAVHRQTEGNPLFVQEVVRYLVEEGLLAQQEGRYRPTKDTPLEMNIPEGLRDVIGKRLSLISKECNQLLSIAAVIGREFSLEVLKKVSGLSDDELFSACEEAKKAAVVEERSGVGAAVTYRFAHAFFRQTLYEEMIAPRRIRLHQQVARALEAIYETRLGEHATELAEHFSHSSDSADLEKAVSYGEMAAKRAIDVYAYGEAVRLLDQAVKIQEIYAPEDKAKRCDLLMTLSDAFSLAGRATQQAVDIELQEAFSLAEAIGDKTRASRACQLAIQHIAYAGDLLSSLRGLETARWVERADKYAEPGTAARALADLGMAVSKYGTRFLNQQTEPIKDSIRLFNRSFELARKLDDMEILCYSACFRLAYLASPQHIRERWLLAEELAARPHTGVTTRTLGTALSYAAFTLLESGKRQLAEELIKELWELSEHSGQTNLWFMAMSARGMLATLDGRLEEADEIGRQARVRGQELDFATYAAVCEFNASFDARLLLGKTDELAQLIEIFNVPLGAVTGGLLYAIFKSPAETIEYLEKNVVSRPGIGTPDDETFAYTDVYNLIAAVTVGHRPSAELLLKRLSDIGLYTAYMMSLQFPSRHLGAAAALLERPDEARRYYQKALKMATEISYRPEIALSRLELAELLLEHYPDEKKEALEHLDFAIKEFREMKMQPSLERALRHKDILKA